MTQDKPRLMTFAASHFCEKARWALVWHGIAYDEIGWPPGLHLVPSLLANFARPKELPLHHGMKGPDALVADVNRWSDRPTMRWVRGQYRAYRNSAASPAVGA